MKYTGGGYVEGAEPLDSFPWLRYSLYDTAEVNATGCNLLAVTAFFMCSRTPDEAC